MSDSAKTALDDRLRRILRQALLATEIPCLDNNTLPSPEYMGTAVGWRINDTDLELVFNSKELTLGPLQCSVSLTALAGSLLTLLVYDEAKAGSALVDALQYLCVEVAQILPSLNMHLSIRSLNAVEKKDIKEMERLVPSGKGIFDMSRESLTQMQQALEHHRKVFERQLRADRDRRGGSEAKHDWTDSELESLSKKYDDLKPIWLEAKRIAKGAQKSKERSRRVRWRAEVLRAYPHLPLELLDRFSSPRADDAKPSDIAILHAKQETGVAAVYSTRELREKIRTWKLKPTTRPSSPSAKSRKLKQSK